MGWPFRSISSFKRDRLRFKAVDQFMGHTWGFAADVGAYEGRSLPRGRVTAPNRFWNDRDRLIGSLQEHHSGEQGREFNFHQNPIPQPHSACYMRASGLGRTVGFDIFFSNFEN